MSVCRHSVSSNKPTLQFFSSPRDGSTAQLAKNWRHILYISTVGLPYVVIAWRLEINQESKLKRNRKCIKRMMPRLDVLTRRTWNEEMRLKDAEKERRRRRWRHGVWISIPLGGSVLLTQSYNGTTKAHITFTLVDNTSFRCFSEYIKPNLS